jgi:membrane-associated protease RseP (regulator of RpoE activity)
MSQQRDRLRVIAVGLAAAALAIVLIAVIVVSQRGGAAVPAPQVVTEQPPHDYKVTADDVMKLEHAIETIGGGVRVTDHDLQQRLGLGDDDVITSIDGTEITVAMDLHQAIFEISMMKARTLYVELLRDHGPALVRWQLDGDLRAARYASRDFGVGLNPLLPPPPPDPLLDTIAKLDDTHFTMPEATATQLRTNMQTSMRGARVVPSVRNGVPSGFKLYAVRPSSVFARLGFMNGDTVLKINGHDLADAATALEAYEAVRGSKTLIVELERRMNPVTITITVK